jgi:hypothetical protein
MILLSLLCPISGRILHAASHLLLVEMHAVGAVMLYLLARMKTMKLTLSSRSDLALSSGELLPIQAAWLLQGNAFQVGGTH